MASYFTVCTKSTKLIFEAFFHSYKPSYVTRMQAASQSVTQIKTPYHAKHHNHLPIALGDTLQLILLLDGIRVTASLGSVDQLFGQALSN
jgi:hypothetical protein